MKWQRKLGAPKPEETFYDLYDRARLLESREKQYSAGNQRTHADEHSSKTFRSSQKGQKS